MSTEDMMEIDTTGDGKSVNVKYVEENSMDRILDSLKEISKTSTTLDSRYIWRALKDLSAIRKTCLDSATLSALVNILYPDSSSFKVPLLKMINENHKSQVTDSDKIRSNYPAAFYQIVDSEAKVIDVSAELNGFIHLLVQLYLLDNKKFEELKIFNEKVIIPKLLSYYNQRSLDLINAKLWFYIAIGNEKVGETSNAALRSEMIRFLKSASLKHDNETRAMLINLIIRSYLSAGEVESASDFVSKVDFPTSDVSSPLEARYYFYLSKVNAIQLDYSTANEYIIAAIKKAPHNSKSLGFLQQANKIHCVIQLLMGDIPELSFFHQPDMEHSLYAYFHLTNTVKIGDLKKFTSVITKYKQQFIQDGNYQLCVRLRSNVIKTGIRIISLTYKKVSLKDICLKLRLDSEQTVEYMVSRAIRDGVIQANINHEKGYVETSEVLNIYDTKEPQQIFDERIRFVNQLHDESIIAMRFPQDNKKKKNGDSKNNQQDDLNDMEMLDDLSDLSDIDDLGFL
ncbi:hypothetical protein KAFR_0A03250 [Kazachstania africana CBS 2517]|uniref:PCI domain-containing protein n=1 Tax=Kazachstania africana (strain ATCC 22294 / BCRC 22015 / CBS 2517 / CECT 1963 / NBRC 1671 / NRRL Y-8276) TaxID=1071382 RepID=H2AN10_KAZAF|nr:hypothetical protein KAFR_0A03250 [Kazachstania africana CBS 2517]CCF55760.1 hypothetical protein KAFR_0A03250 [Kazachstania africana CBS 2517]